MLPRTITAHDVLVSDASGRLTEGHGELPDAFATDVKLYRASERKACVFAAPRFAF